MVPLKNTQKTIFHGNSKKQIAKSELIAVTQVKFYYHLFTRTFKCSVHIKFNGLQSTYGVVRDDSFWDIWNSRPEVCNTM